MRLWLSMFACLLLAIGQVTLATQGAAAAACKCSDCVQVQCCPCDTVPSSPVSFPIRSSIQVDVQCLVAASNTIILFPSIPDFAGSISERPVIFASAVDVYKRNCVYLI